MNKDLMQSLVAWLGDKLAARRNGIGDLLNRLRDVAASMGNSIRLNTKFLNLLDEVANQREKELDLIHEIEDVELKHRLFRERGMLRRAEDKPKKKILEEEPLTIQEEEPMRDDGLMKWFLAWWFFLREEERPEPNA